MNSSEVHAYLNSFNNFESQLHQLSSEDFNLNRIQEFLELAGKPAQNLKIIHVAGTNGKGSTCAFLAGILQEAGYSVGLYTSPHLHRVNERIRILNRENLSSQEIFPGAISDDDLAVALTQLRPLAAAIKNEGKILTYFEVLTVAAVCYFAQCHVDVVILETGLGGRLDATNAMESAIAVITSLSLDHTRLLGSTLAQIASEKAGIVKNSHQKVVIAPQEKEAMDVLMGRCREFGVPPLLVDPAKFEKIKIGLKGYHQRINAATAIETLTILKTMGYQISDEAMSEGLRKVRWPGRFELIKNNPDVLVDCAHNDASAKALAKTLTEEFSDRRIILVLGISKDKDAAAICGALAPSASHIIMTQAQHPRSYQFTLKEGKSYFSGKTYEIIDHLPDALEKALMLAGLQEVVVVTGSIFVVAQTIDYLGKRGTKHVSV